jgi:hypothetical protein
VVGGSLCIVGQGSTSLIDAKLFTTSDVNGTWQGSLSSGGQSITGSGMITDGVGTIPFTITQFGTYGPLVVSDAAGASVPLGPLGGLFPFSVTSDNQPCVQAGATAPSAPAVTAAPTPAEPTHTVTQTQVTTTTTTMTSTPPWGWSATGGAVVFGAGLLATGRRRGEGPDDVPEDTSSPEYRAYYDQHHGINAEGNDVLPAPTGDDSEPPSPLAPVDDAARPEVG